MGGVQAVQTATIVFALPFSLVLILIAVALWRGVREDYQAREQQERRLRQRMRRLIDE